MSSSTKCTETLVQTKGFIVKLVIGGDNGKHTQNVLGFSLVMFCKPAILGQNPLQKHPRNLFLYINLCVPSGFFILSYFIF